MNEISFGRVSVATAAFAISVYILLGFFYPFDDKSYSGFLVYDFYYQRVLEGRFDLPLRMISVEGHYLADGTAFTYHGLAPLITRLSLGWLFPTDGTFFPYASVVFWCTIGSASYHIILHKLISTHLHGHRLLMTTQVCGGLLVWLASPGVILVANSSLYIEPIAVSYAATGVFFLATFLNSRGEISYRAAILLCSLCVAIALHARPHVAAGLAVGLFIFGLRIYIDRSLRCLVTLLLGVALVASSAAGYLYVNHLKFGDPFEAHAGFSRDDRVQMGTVFLGDEDYESERAQGFEEFGRFNAARLPGNIIAYTFDWPQKTVHQQIEKVLESQARYAGFVRLEGPFFGILPLWVLWFVVVGVGFRRRPKFHQSVILGSGAAIALMILSYATVTFRYRAELWPFLMALVIVSMPAFLERLGRARSPGIHRLMIVAAISSVIVSFSAALTFSHMHRASSGWRDLDKQECLQLLDGRFDPQRASELCADWKVR